MKLANWLIPIVLLAADPAAAAPRTETAVLAGGCFWGMEWVFEHVKGVTSVVSGYAGGSAKDASYDRVSSEGTGHAEAVKITYDPGQLSYAQLLQVYFTVAHDPTEVNRQGPDVGSSYRSAIFPQSPAQARLATGFIARVNAAHFTTRRPWRPKSKTAPSIPPKNIISISPKGIRPIRISLSTTGRRSRLFRGKDFPSLWKA